jgi:hypothetical protein
MSKRMGLPCWGMREGEFDFHGSDGPSDVGSSLVEENKVARTNRFFCCNVRGEAASLGAKKPEISVQ